MAGLINNYAASLFEQARKEGKLEDFYHGAVSLSENSNSLEQEPPEELKNFVRSMLHSQVKPALGRFIELAREELKIIDVEVVSAVPLKDEQLAELERKLIHTVRKRVNIKTIVDPAIMGGLRVVIDNYVIDSSIKSQFEGIKESLYEGVYFRHE